jgi:Cdc6-like AAA superfamily ATPase
MDSSTSAIRNTLDSFFSEKDLAVLVIRGSWGIGKTYFWENYVQNRINKKELKQTAYSYISLFGLHDLSELKSKIFRTGKLLKSREQFKEELKSFSLNENRISEALFGVRSGSQDFLRFLAPLYQFAKYVPQVKGFSSIIDLAEYQLISNYLICLDDIERKEESLKIRQIMGFVDELSKRKQCKVILILNEKTLSEQDLSEFNKYREKVIDLEIEYKPTIKKKHPKGI